MDVQDIEKKIIDVLKKGQKTTDEIEKEIGSSLEECSDKIVYALIRLKNKNKILNKFENKVNVWSMK